MSDMNDCQPEEVSKYKVVVVDNCCPMKSSLVGGSDLGLHSTAGAGDQGFVAVADMGMFSGVCGGTSQM